VWPVGKGPAPKKGLRRWRAVARAAAQQSRRAHIPSVDGVLSTAELTQRIGEAVESGATVLALHESAAGQLADLSLAQAKSVMLVVGPEGGIAPDELAAVTGAGAVAVRMGPTVLRTSTAAAVALGALGCVDAAVGSAQRRRGQLTSRVYAHRDRRQHSDFATFPARPSISAPACSLCRAAANHWVR